MRDGADSLARHPVPCMYRLDTWIRGHLRMLRRDVLPPGVVLRCLAVPASFSTATRTCALDHPWGHANAGLENPAVSMMQKFHTIVVSTARNQPLVVLFVVVRGARKHQSESRIGVAVTRVHSCRKSDRAHGKVSDIKWWIARESKEGIASERLCI